MNTKTSETVLVLGLYASSCCLHEVVFEAGDTFSRCPKCERLCEWELIEPIVPVEEWPQWEEQAA